MMRPMRVRLRRQVEEDEHGDRDRHHQTLVGGEGAAEKRGTAESRSPAGTLLATALRPQTIVTSSSIR